jgi:hypothetical protein
MMIFGSVVALPTGGGANCNNVGTTTSHGFNFADGTSCGLTGTGDSQATTNNPLLGALTNNGGPTQTMLPQDGPSQLIDGVPAAFCQADGASGITTDQRALPRPDTASPNCDVASSAPARPMLDGQCMPIQFDPKTDGCGVVAAFTG